MNHRGWFRQLLPMPQKTKKQHQQRGEDDAEQPFQAVILTDSYDEQFLPISNEMPRCLMPLCNVPLIEYTLELLAISEVQDVFIICTSHIDKIKSYFANSHWLKPHSVLNVQIIQAPESMSVGDAMRELDAHQLITTDFILTFGDLVSNMRLAKAMEAHRARRKTDKNSIMTMVLKEATHTHPSRPKDHSGIFALDPSNGECVFYEPVDTLPRKSRLEMSPEVFEKRSQIEIRNDLVDPYLDICSVEVPALFTENFDWQRLREDFVHGILTSDILGKTIYSEIVQDQYIARVENEQLYSTISKHILTRWAFPVVPETNLMHGDNYEFLRGNLYKCSNVNLSRSCIVDENVQIGSGTVIGENSRVANSVIGRNCRIGDNVHLHGVFLWDNVVIGDNCSISKSILGENVTIAKNVTVKNGSIISLGVTIGPDTQIPKYSRLSLNPQPKASMFGDSSDDEDDTTAQSKVLHGDNLPDVYFWAARSSNDEDIDSRNISLGSLAFDIADLCINDDELDDSASDVGELSDDDFDDDMDSIGGAWNLQETRNAEEFKKELSQTIERAIVENHTVDTAALEITGLRMSQNGTYEEVRDVLIQTLLRHIDVSSNAVGNMRAIFSRWGPLISKVTHGLEEQVHLLRVFQKHAAAQESLARLFLTALQQLYNDDVVEEDAVLMWYNSDSSKSDTLAEQNLREKATKFVDWLQEAEEETSDEDDDDDDDDESS